LGDRDVAPNDDDEADVYDVAVVLVVEVILVVVEMGGVVAPAAEAACRFGAIVFIILWDMIRVVLVEYNCESH